MTSATTYIKEYDQLKSENSNYRSYWQEVARYTLPSRDFYNQWYPGSRRNTRIYDTTAMYACEQLAGTLHSLLTSPSQKWFKLKISDPDHITTLEEDQWLDSASNVLYNVFNSQESRFNSEAHEYYSELSAFGNGIMFSEFRNGKIRFKSYPLSSCVGAEGPDGMIDTIYRECESSAISARMFFKENASKNIKEKADKDPYCKVKFLHVVKPRNKYTKGGIATQKPFSSCYLDVESKQIMAEGGYDTFPYQWARFSKRSGEVYGFGPGMASFPDTRMINRIKEVSIRGLEKIVDPPLLVPSDSVIGPLIINSGGIINYDSTQDPISPLNLNGRPDFAEGIMQRYEKRIMQHFYVDWLGSDTDQKTEYMKATVSNNLQQKNLQQLGPLLSRLNMEFTGPLISRVFDLAVTNGLIPPPPETLAGMDYKVEYVSPIAQAQKSADLDSIIRSVNVGVQLAGVAPSVMDNFDLDAIIRYASLDVNYIPPKLMRTLDEVGQMRQAQAQAQAEAQQVALEEQASGTLKNSAAAAKSMMEASVNV